MRVPFTKMHGLGNDFVVLDARDGPTLKIDAATARAVSNRHTGIGCDQLIVIEPSSDADLRMRIFNSDGSEVGACGNASRAVGLLMGRAVVIETGGGLIRAEPGDTGVAVEMGLPRFEWQDIPLSYAIDTHSLPLAWEELTNPIAVNVGNPHVIFFVSDCDAIDLARLGPMIENDPIFPERVNVNVATVLAENHIRLRVWERGAGLTLACGTGACATAVGAIRRNLAAGKVTIDLPGGSLGVEWREGAQVLMTGPAQESFRGSFDPEDLGFVH